MDRSRSRRVLVVEDDPDIQMILKERLATSGYDVQLASNGAEAIGILESGERPCAVLVDLLMPGIVGQELLEYLRDDDVLVAIPVAIVSGSPHLAPAGYKVFRKPLDIRPLLDFLREACARASKQEEARDAAR
jgi:CheY-like chemotaxis protein